MYGRITLSTQVHVDQLSVAGDLRTALQKHQITVQIRARMLCPNTTVIEADKGFFFVHAESFLLLTGLLGGSA